MEKYDHQEIEKKWQSYWLEQGSSSASEVGDKKKFYCLIEFPYPSGDGLHVGHPRPYIGLDIIARKRRMQGYNVLYPIGWDAFGLPTENFAIKTGKDPKIVTKENTDNFRRQIQSLGISFDWSREINTTDPEYYRWTQWLFLQFYKHGLAYKTKTLINWCPKDKIGLANEEVIDDKCERCGTAVEQREKEQWMLAITKYADRLASDLDDVDYPEAVKAQQKNWIGRSEGALIKFDDIEVFTTRPETIYGATFIAIAGAEDRDTGKRVKNPATGELIPVWEAEYVMDGVGTGAVMGVPAHDERDFEFAKKHDLPIKQVIAPHLFDKNNPPRQGVETIRRRVVQGVIKHWENDQILVLKWKKQPWTTFVIGGAEGNETGEEAIAREVREETGFKNFRVVRRLGWQMFSEFFATHKGVNRFAEMEVYYIELQSDDQAELTAEEQEMHELAWIPTDQILSQVNPCSEKYLAWDYLQNGDHAYEGSGDLINSGEFDGLKAEEAREKIIAKFGVPKTTYKLRDWVFSRQRYWGEPIPMIFCEKCSWQPVPESELPVKLPEVENYQPRDDGESPLASVADWVRVKCPKCRGEARRETDTMPNWAGSSWYYLRYTDPNNAEKFADASKLQYWLGERGVDWYNGGMEHTTLHLLYSRFWHKFLFDLKLVPTPEPYHKRTSHGIILAENGEKMSKSRGNVVNPDKIVELYGADTLRLYEMFLGPFDQAVKWSTESIIGSRRFLERVWKLSDNLASAGAGISAAEIKKITDDIEAMKFNTAVSGLMIMLNAFEKSGVDHVNYEVFLTLLAPFAPHIAEELWQKLGHADSIHAQAWPVSDKKITPQSACVIIIQINGVMRDSMEVAGDLDQAAVENLALAQPKVRKWLDNKPVKKVVYVPGRLLNFVV